MSSSSLHGLNRALIYLVVAFGYKRLVFDQAKKVTRATPARCCLWYGLVVKKGRKTASKRHNPDSPHLRWLDWSMCYWLRKVVANRNLGGGRERDMYTSVRFAPFVVRRLKQLTTRSLLSYVDTYQIEGRFCLVGELGLVPSTSAP